MHVHGYLLCYAVVFGDLRSCRKSFFTNYFVELSLRSRLLLGALIEGRDPPIARRLWGVIPYAVNHFTE